MESNLQKCIIVESGAGGPRAEEKVYRWRAKSIGESHEHGNRKVILLGGCGGAHVAQRRSSCSLWGYELLCVFRQIGIAHEIQTSGQLNSLRARRDIFSWHDLERKIYCSCWNWMVYFWPGLRRPSLVGTLCPGNTCIQANWVSCEPSLFLFQQRVMWVWDRKEELKHWLCAPQRRSESIGKRHQKELS